MLSSAGFGVLGTVAGGLGDRTRDAKGVEDSAFAASAPWAGAAFSVDGEDAASELFSSAALSAVSEVLSPGEVFPGFCAPAEVAAAELFVAVSFASGMSPTPVFGFSGGRWAATGGATSEGMTPVFSPDELELSVGFVEAD